MNWTHSRIHRQQAQRVSTLITHSSIYGVVTMVSQELGAVRKTLYHWKAKGQAPLEAAFTPSLQAAGSSCSLERAILTLLVEGHARYRGIQRCLRTLLHQGVNLGTIAAVVQTTG